MSLIGSNRQGEKLWSDGGQGRDKLDPEPDLVRTSGGLRSDLVRSWANKVRKRSARATVQVWLRVESYSN